MPNWCHNHLTATGSEGSVAALAEKAKAEDSAFRLGAFVPEPKCLVGLDEVSGRPAWLTWRLTHWQTKWEVSGARAEVEDESVSFRFDTAWGPPVPVVAALAQQHPDLEVTYRWGEPGMDAGGCLVYHGGRLTSQIEGPAEEFLAEDEMWF